MKKQILFEFEVLTNKLSSREIDKYNKLMDAYNEHIEKVESMGMEPYMKKPEYPDLNIGFRKIYVNLSDKIFTAIGSEWNEDEDCETVHLEYINIDGDLLPETMIIKIDKKKFIFILESLGHELHAWEDINNL